MTKLNKLKGYGTSLEGWEKWGDIWVISLKVKNIFDFTFFLYINQLEEENWDKFLHFPFFILVHSSLHHLHLLLSFSWLKILQPYNSSCFQGLFLEFLHLFFMFFGMIVDGIYLNLEKFFIVMYLCLFDMEYERIKKCRKHDT